MSRQERYFQRITREIRNFSENNYFRIISVFRVFRLFCRLFFGWLTLTHSAPLSAVFRLFSISGVWHLCRWLPRLQPENYFQCKLRDFAPPKSAGKNDFIADLREKFIILADRQPRTIPTKDLPHQVVFLEGWCANCRDPRKRQNTHHPQFCTRDVDRQFCGGGEWISQSDNLGNGRNTASIALFQRRELTEFWGKLGEFCEKTRWVRFGPQIKGRKELTEFSPRSSARAKKLTVSNRTLRNRIRPFSDLGRGQAVTALFIPC